MKVLELPPQFLDLKMIENVWRRLKHTVHARMPKNIYCQEEWAKIPEAII